MPLPARRLLSIAVRYSGLLGGLAVLYVLLDFIVDVRPPQVLDSYRFELGELLADRPRILRQDNLSILVIRRSEATVARLRQATQNLQDPGSNYSRQPDFAENPLRSKYPQLFVSYAIGTDLGCSLEVKQEKLGEVCSEATYDFAGRALLAANEFQNLAIPDYTFSDDFKTLTIWP